MSRLLGIAAAQLSPVELDPAASYLKLAAEVRRVAEMTPRLDLIVFPELFLTGMATASRRVPVGFLEGQAEHIPGPLTDRLCALAADTKRWLVPGTIIEQGDGGTYNTALAISPDGEIVSTYRKLFPWMPHERALPGRDHAVFDIPGVGRIGLAICYDGWFPEMMRTLAWMGAEVIVQPTYTPTADREQEVVLARANAITNQLYVVNPNIGRVSGAGRSVVVDPEGRILSEAGSSEEILTLMLDLDLVAAVRQHGTLGLNAVWKQLRDFPPPFPPAEFGYATGDVMRGLGPLQPADASDLPVVADIPNSFDAVSLTVAADPSTREQT